MVAAIRPDEVNVPLFVHIVGAAVLVGALALALAALSLAWRRADPAEAAGLDRFAFRALLFVAVPAFVVMRAGAFWVWREEGWDDVEEEPAWLGVGYATSEPGALVLVAAAALAWLAARRRERGRGLRRLATVLTALLVLAYLVAVWAMTTKPQ